MKVFAIRNGGSVTVIIGAKHYTRVGEEGVKLFTAAQDYRANPTVETLQILEDLTNPYSKYVRTGLLTEKSGQLFLGQSTIPLPQALASTITEYLDNGYPIQSLINFWHWSLLNPNTTARDGFFEYCRAYGVTITDSGMAVLYKAVTHKEDNRASDLAHFVATEWLQVKTQKQIVGANFSPKAYGVFTKFNGFTVSLLDAGDDTREDYIGNLDDLFKAIQDEDQDLTGTTIYTDKHSRTMDIKLGVPSFKKREQCDPNIHNECSYGLHVGSFKYVHAFGNSNDTVFATLVNPMNVVALPAYDNSKIRVCEYLPYAIMNRQGQDWEELPSVFFEEAYTPYIANQLLTLGEALDESQVDINTPAWQLRQEQINIVHTKLVQLGEAALESGTTLDRLINDAPEPVEAEYQETYFDVDDPNASNQLAQKASPYPSDDLRWFNIRGEDAWKNAIHTNGYTGSLAEFMESYSEDDETDDEEYCCDDCGCYPCDCKSYINEAEAMARWQKAVADGTWDDTFWLFVEDVLASNGIYVEDWP